MKLTQEQINVIEKLSAIESFNGEFKKQKEDILKLSDAVNALKTSLSVKEKSLADYEAALNARADERLKQLLSIEEQIQIIVREKTKSFPWLSEAISDYLNMLDNEVAEYLVAKKNPAYLAAKKVREIAVEKKVLTKQLLLTRYRIKYYETLFPFLTDFNDDNIDELLIQVIKDHELEDCEEDPVKLYVTAGEYEHLSVTERNQRALDRYVLSRKSPQQIGRDYERYIGYKYELRGYEVKYQGIADGFEDLGRDLICLKGDMIEVVQCKCWSIHKTIHEKHINQLFGTAVKFSIDQFSGHNRQDNISDFTKKFFQGNIRAVFVTSTKLSDTARKFADALGIEVVENEPLKPYPIIKCHTNKQTGEKIYHLPFDQMYDKTKLEEKFGEFYAMTVSEAEAHGFRRAWRWHGTT